MTRPTAVPEPFSAEGAALIEAGYPLDAVEPLRHAVAAGEPSGPDLLARAYLESRSWHAAAEWLTPLVQAGHVRFAGRARAGTGRDGRPGPAPRTCCGWPSRPAT